MLIAGTEFIVVKVGILGAAFTILLVFKLPFGANKLMTTNIKSNTFLNIKSVSKSTFETPFIGHSHKKSKLFFCQISYSWVLFHI